MKLQFAAHTDVGRRRSHNEDAYDLAPDESLFVVADGLGGYAAGEIASQLAVDSVAGFFRAMREDDELTWPQAARPERDFVENKFANAVHTAHRRIVNAANDDHALTGMSTTLVGLHFVGDRYYVAHVGDSRCYRVRDGQLEAITEDHSLVTQMKNTMNLSEAEVAAFPFKNVVLRALGSGPAVEVDVANDRTRHGDLYLLCTDGLNGELSDRRIAELVRQEVPTVLGASEAELEGLCRALVAAACRAGGRDNVTVVAIAVQAPAD